MTSAMFSQPDSLGMAMAILFALVGVIFGYVLRSFIGRWREDVARKRIEEQEKNAQEEISNRLKQADVDARAKIVAARERARNILMERAETEFRNDAAELMRHIQLEAKETATVKAREIVATAVQNCAAALVADLATSSVPILNDEMKGRIIGKEGRNLRAFEAAAGVSLLMDEIPDAAVISSFDPMRREIARRALSALIEDGRIHPERIEESVKEAEAVVKNSFLEEGIDAAQKAGVAGLEGDVLRVLGQLRFRTSFSQNLMAHSVEVALLAGSMAEEFGVDPSVARRVGLLHDIGKVLETVSGKGHAVVGADFLRLHGETEEITLAVASHHSESGVDGGIYGVLCAVADAISSSRPGARKEAHEVYVERLSRMEEIVKAHPEVLRTYAVRAGRDVRVIVDPGKVDDAGAVILAKDLCKEISNQVKVPGQVRITVVREMRVTEYAR